MLQPYAKPPLHCLGCAFRVIVLLEGEPLAQSEILRTLDQVFIKDVSVNCSVHFGFVAISRKSRLFFFHLRIMETTVALWLCSFLLLPRSVPCHNPVSALCRQIFQPHGLVYSLMCSVKEEKHLKADPEKCEAELNFTSSQMLWILKSMSYVSVLPSF